MVSDQRLPRNEFEVFDRQTWQHLASIQLRGVGGTDGIAIQEAALPGYPLGVFAAVDRDRSTAVIGWHVIAKELGPNGVCP